MIAEAVRSVVVLRHSLNYGQTKMAQPFIQALRIAYSEFLFVGFTQANMHHSPATLKE